jgi:hypothetical protein
MTSASGIEAKADEVLNRLAETDRNDAAYRYNARLAEHKYDKTVDALFLTLEGTVEQRKAKARSDDLAEMAYIDYLEAQKLFDGLHNERETLRLRFEYCRSVMANRRMGG